MQMLPPLPEDHEDRFQSAYAYQARDYHRMIAAEDADGHLAGTLSRIAPWRGRRVLDLGTGTGRLPRIMADETALFTGLDHAPSMLRENQRLRISARGAWRLVCGDMRRLPFPPAAYDLVIEGWALGHFCAWFAPDWMPQVEIVLQEMDRVLAPGGQVVLIETLGTGQLDAAPPTAGLADLFAWLEEERGFFRTTISTDYQFRDPQEAARRMAFFFGPGLTEKILENGWARVPEWTGIWVKG